jgi:hypothetical protein
VDLSGVRWKRDTYDVEGHDRLYTGNDARAVKVLAELRDKLTDVGRMRALGFCVSWRTPNTWPGWSARPGSTPARYPVEPRKRTVAPQSPPCGPAR